MSECLASSNHEIMTSESGFNALAKVELFKPDLIIIDIELPDMSGFDVCKRVKSNPKTQYILVLLMTANEARDLRTRAVSVNADDLMEKTFDSFDLISKTKSLLRLKHLSDQLKQKYVELEEKNKILEFQLKMGKSVQRSILPKVDFVFNNVQFLSEYMPAMDIGGDFYDVFPVNDDTIAVVIGDVSGHGIAAALLTSMLNLMIKNLSIKYCEPDQLLFHLNNEFYKIFENSEHEMYACVFYAIIDTKGKEIFYSNAGEALPIYVNAKENTAAELHSSGIPIGLIKDSKYEFLKMNYGEGDLILFYTDGLSDTFFKDNPIAFSTRLKEILLDSRKLSSPSEIVNIVLSSFYGYNASENEKMELDDVSIVMCKM